jgi:hypothetical protein
MQGFNGRGGVHALMLRRTAPASHSDKPEAVARSGKKPLKLTMLPAAYGA